MHYIDEACWKGYQQYGMKEKNGKQVPNCVPIQETDSYCAQCLAEYLKKSVNESEYIDLLEPGLNELQGEKVSEPDIIVIIQDLGHLPAIGLAELGNILIHNQIRTCTTRSKIF